MNWAEDRAQLLGSEVMCECMWNWEQEFVDEWENKILKALQEAHRKGQEDMRERIRQHALIDEAFLMAEFPIE